MQVAFYQVPACSHFVWLAHISGSQSFSQLAFHCLQNAENDMSIIAAYYGLPVLSVRAATFHQMLRNQHGYKVGAGTACVEA